MPERLTRPGEWFNLRNFRGRAKSIEAKDPHTEYITHQIEGYGRVEILTRWEDKQIYAHSGPFLVYDGQTIIRIEGNPNLLQSVEDQYLKDLLDLTVNMHRSRYKKTDWAWSLKLPLGEDREMVLRQLSEQTKDPEKAGTPGFPTSNWIISGSNETIGEVFVLDTDEVLDKLQFNVVRIK